MCGAYKAWEVLTLQDGFVRVELGPMKHGYGHGHRTRHGHADTTNNLKKSHNLV